MQPASELPGIAPHPDAADRLHGAYENRMSATGSSNALALALALTIPPAPRRR
jgi:hypothetical protein